MATISKKAVKRINDLGFQQMPVCTKDVAKKTELLKNGLHNWVMRLDEVIGHLSG